MEQLLISERFLYGCFELHWRCGKELVTIYNFESGTDRLGFDGNSVG